MYTRGTWGFGTVYKERVDSARLAESGAVAAARGGDAAGFGLLVEQHQEAAFRAAWLIVRDAPAAEDVAQEAFIRAYRGISRFREGEPFRPWLLRIVTNLALNEVRARSRRSGLVERAGATAGPRIEPPSARAEESEETATLVAAINELPLDDRVVLYLRYFLELPEREMATAIGKPAGTVKSRLHRAGQRLRAVIEQKYPQLRERDDG